MSARSKLLWLLAAVALLTAVGFFLSRGLGDSAIAVQTGTVARERIVQVVTASGEITPNNYINIGRKLGTALGFA